MAQTYVLEAVIVASIMVSAVTFVVTYEAPRHVDDPIDGIMERIAREFIQIAYDVPSQGDCPAETWLDDFVIEAAHGGRDMWDARMNVVLPPGFNAELWLDNGVAYYPLHADRDFLGIAHAQTWMPFFSGTRTSPTTNTVSGTGTAQFDTMAWKHSQIVAPKGEGVRFTIARDNGITSHETTTWGLTALHNTTGETVTRDAVGSTYWTSASPPYMPAFIRTSASPVHTAVKVDVPQGDSPFLNNLTEGQPIRVTAPIDWMVEAPASKNAAWLVPAEPQPGGLTAYLKSNQTTDQLLTLELTPPSSPVHPFSVITASAGNGSLAKSSLIVVHDLPVDTSLPQVAAPTVPYPLRPGTSALFGVAFGNGGSKETITRVDVEIPGGYDLLHNRGAGAPLFRDDPAAIVETYDPDDDGNWTWIDARHVQWTGNRTIEANQATYWLVELPIAAADAYAATSIEPVNSNGVSSTLTFPNDYASTSYEWANSPGIVRHRVPPQLNESLFPELTELARAGYPWELPGASFDYTASLNATLGVSYANGRYASAADGAGLVDVENGIGGAKLAVGERLVRLGTQVRAEADFANLVDTLATHGVTDFNLTLNLYAPPTMGCGPIRSWNGTSGGQLPLAKTRAMDLWDADGVPALYIAGDNKLAQRVDYLGAPRWSTQLPGAGTLVTHVRAGALQTPLVIVGDDHGSVRALEPTTGQVVWSRALDPAGNSTLAGPPDAVVALRVDDATLASERVLVATASGRVEWVDALTGNTVGEIFDMPAAVIRDAQWDATRDEVVILATGALLRLNDTMVLTSEMATSAHTITLTPGGIVATSETATMLHAWDTLAPAPLLTHAAQAPIATSGDIDGDGFEDQLVALGNLTLVRIDGETQAIAYRDNVGPNITGGSTTIYTVEPPFSPQFECPRTDLYSGDGCIVPHPDLSELMEGTDSVHPTHLAITPSGIIYTWTSASRPFIERYDASLQHQWQITVPPREAPTAVVAGEWRTPLGAPADRILLASELGVIKTRAVSNGTHREDYAPTSFSGRFSAVFPIPEGGFFGTHLVEAVVSWTEAGAPREARVMDWFAVVAPDGTPNANPAYRVVMNVEDASKPRVDPGDPNP